MALTQAHLPALPHVPSPIPCRSPSPRSRAPDPPMMQSSAHGLCRAHSKPLNGSHQAARTGLRQGVVNNRADASSTDAPVSAPLPRSRFTRRHCRQTGETRLSSGGGRAVPSILNPATVEWYAGASCIDLYVSLPKVKIGTSVTDAFPTGFVEFRQSTVGKRSAVFCLAFTARWE